jgi:hypothetical protein
MQTRIYTAPGFGASALLEAVRAWFVAADYETQLLQLPDGSLVVQGYRDDFWRSAIGLAAAITVSIKDLGDDRLEVTLGASAWGDKLLVAGLGLLFFLPLVLSAAWGTWQQYELDKQVWTAIEAALPTTATPFETVTPETAITTPIRTTPGSWFDETTEAVYSVQFFQRMESWQRAMADGKIDQEEIHSQAERVQQILRNLEPSLSPEAHAKLTAAFGELAVLQGMQSYTLLAHGKKSDLGA